jgi:hypothetical protein
LEVLIAWNWIRVEIKIDVCAGTKVFLKSLIFESWGTLHLSVMKTVVNSKKKEKERVYCFKELENISHGNMCDEIC